MAPGSEQGEDVLEAGGDGAALKAAMESWLDQALELRAERIADRIRVIPDITG